MGRTSTTGWSEGALSKHIYAVPPFDGIQGFDFVARAPDSDVVVLPVLAPISATSEETGIDIANYWGDGRRLAGIRVHAVANAKIVEIARANAAAAVSTTMPLPTATWLVSPDEESVPGYEADIKPLFRVNDAAIMKIFGGFDLHRYDDVRVNAEKILTRLKVDMPCDGLWPQADIDKFAAWKDGGMPA
jgi:hypothetical protein